MKRKQQHITWYNRWGRVINQEAFLVGPVTQTLGGKYAQGVKGTYFTGWQIERDGMCPFLTATSEMSLVVDIQRTRGGSR